MPCSHVGSRVGFLAAFLRGLWQPDVWATFKWRLRGLGLTHGDDGLAIAVPWEGAQEGVCVHCSKDSLRKVALLHMYMNRADMLQTQSSQGSKSWTDVLLRWERHHTSLVGVIL